MQDRHGWVTRSVVTAVVTSMTVVGSPMVAAAAVHERTPRVEEPAPLSDEEVAQELGQTHGSAEEESEDSEDQDTAVSSPPVSKKDESEEEPAPAPKPDPKEEPRDEPRQQLQAPESEAHPRPEAPRRDEAPTSDGATASPTPANKDESEDEPAPAPKPDPTAEPKDRPKVGPKQTAPEEPAPKPAAEEPAVTPPPDYRVSTPAPRDMDDAASGTTSQRRSPAPAGPPARGVDVWEGRNGAVLSADWLGYLSLSGMEPSADAHRDIPPEMLALYQEATTTCPGLPWAVLAAVGKVETDHGRNTGVSSAGARGPMQFMPATWEKFAVDGDGDGERRIDGRTDSVYSAASYLCEHGADDPATLPEALYAYNQSWGYVDQVMRTAERYVDSDMGAIATEPVDLTDLLANPRLTVYSGGLGDIAEGRIDSRVLDLLALLTQQHDITVVSLQTGHSKYVAGTTSVSNHYHGRAVDVAAIDREPVSAASPRARALVAWLASLDGPQRPREVGSPFPGFSSQPGHFSDADHLGHLHIGWGAPDGRETDERLIAGAAEGSGFADAATPAHVGASADTGIPAPPTSPADTPTSPETVGVHMQTLRRDEMASAIARSLVASGVALPEASDQGFTDLTGGAHDDAINQLAELGVVSGTTKTTYSPDEPVRRDQAAALFVRALEVAEETPLPEAASRFTDTAGNVHETAIDQAAEAGLVFGTTAATYSPHKPVRGDQKDSFLARLRGLLGP